MRALILVDFENEWTNPDSDYYVGDINGVIDRMKNVLAFCRKNDYRIIYTRHVEKDEGYGFEESSDGSKLLDALAPKKGDIVVTKYRISPFYQTDLDKHIDDVDEIVITGILTNLCVRSLAEGAYDREKAITILDDCCVAFDEQTHEFTLKDLKATREEIEIVSSADFLE
jgi:nicotinamidase-related amidase